MPEVQSEAATAVVNVRVRPGRDRDFLAWQERMSAVVCRRSGFVSTSVVTPTDPANDDFVIIYQFASAVQLKAWMDSPERRGMLSEILDTVVDSEATSIVMGGAARGAISAPVTAVITVRVRHGAHEQFRDWQRRMAELMATQTGHLGTNIQEPIAGLQDEWVIMTRFDSEEHLSAWMTSRARARMLDEIEPMIETRTMRKARTSFDGWFPFADGQRPPRAWQQTALVLLTLFPVVCLELMFVYPFLAWMPQAPSTFIANVISVALTGFILVPWAAGVFRWWLVPNASKARLWAGALVVLAGFVLSIIVMEVLFQIVNIAPFHGFN